VVIFPGLRQDPLAPDGRVPAEGGLQGPASNSHTFGSFRNFGNFDHSEMPKLKERQTDVLTL
jgi:hypothetical protein